jgi:hypothetical protein
MVKNLDLQLEYVKGECVLTAAARRADANAPLERNHAAAATTTTAAAVTAAALGPSDSADLPMSTASTPPAASAGTVPCGG